MIRTYVLEVKGRRKTWCFHVDVDPKYLKEWREDGLVIDELANVIPKWYIDLGLPVGVWLFIQDILNLRNPFE